MGITTKGVGKGGGKKRNPEPRKDVKLTYKDKIANLRKKHEATFEALGIKDAYFLPKTVYGTPAECVIFPSEFRKGKNIYTEKVSRDYDPEDPLGTLYVLKYRDDFNTYYPTKQFGHDVKYIVPFSEFKKVETKVEKKKVDFNLPNPDEIFLEEHGIEPDAPVTEMTIRDVFAIIWRKPISNKEWLNELIKSFSNPNKQK